MQFKFELLPGAVQVVLEDGCRPAEVVELLLEAAALAREKARKDLLVISGRDDPATAQMVSQAIDEMRLFGVSEPARIAFVAYTLQQYSVYHFAEQYAQKLGIAAKVLVSVRDAKAWPGIKESGAPLRPGQTPG